MSSFPVDDITLDALEHAMSGVWSVDEEGNHTLVGADYTVSQLLDFLAGHDESQDIILDDGKEGIITTVNYTPSFHINDVIKALIAEVRSLRKE